MDTLIVFERAKSGLVDLKINKKSIVKFVDFSSQQEWILLIEKLPGHPITIQLCLGESPESRDTSGYLQRDYKIHRTCFTSTKSKK